jgi:hypothetical protein
MAGTQGAEVHDAAMEEAMASLEGLGVTVTEPDIDAFRAVADGMREGMEGDAWPEGLSAEIGGL